MALDGKSLGGSLSVPCVQELAKESLVEAPPRYVRPDQDPIFASVLSATQTEVPVIDMQRLLSEESANSELERLHIACKDWGFFQMINHGVSCSLLEKVKEEIQEFFNLPMAEKNKFLQEAGDLEGFGQAYVFSEEQKLDWADMFYVVTLPYHLRKPHLLPKLPLPLRDTIEAYSRELKDISMKTLFLMAKALNMEVEDMNVLFDEGMQSMRMNYYPPCPEPEKVIGLSPHSDPLGITFLLQINDVEGLQIRKDGIWMPVKPLPNAFIVNIGDVLEIVTNGQYKSIEHRAVVNSEKARLSIGTFLTPKLDGDFGPAPSLISPETPPRFARVTVVDFLRNLFSKELDRKTNVDQYYI
ncbi:codeine O-demethylase [Artemisia annua]|uniref:Codeine O-demethylase n=1 Tax=Artemisia annua TaxID=35608 RepID=A0A2U1KGC8_ARTAN|nr:codeine O-demethylase [Artemisia annua]